MSVPNTDQQHKPPTNPNLKSSIVHKPFATGTINIFNPYRNKSQTNTTNTSHSNKLTPPPKILNAELATTRDHQDLDLADLEQETIAYPESYWLDSLLSPWGISAIALLLLVNLIGTGVIWRVTRQETQNHHQVPATATSVGNSNLTNLTGQEFMPLNLSTLGAIKMPEAETSESSNPKLVPISPALAPLDNLVSLSTFNTPYHYVLTEYTGEQSLIRARAKTPQVSLVNFPQGVFIYLGAFKDRQDAEQFVTQLKPENLPAYVYPLD